jgi:hypothetical protein
MTLPVPSVKSVGSSGHVSDHNLLTAALAEAQTNLTAETAARTSADAALATRTTALESSVGTTFPSASTTGYGATTLTAIAAGSLPSIVNNTVISGYNITGQVSIPSTATGVIIQNCKITGDVNYGVYVQSGGSVTIQDCEITAPTGNYNGAALAGAGSGAVTVLRCSLWGYEDGIKPSSNWTIQDSYIHDLGNNSVAVQSISNTTGSTWRYVVNPTALGTAMPFSVSNSVVVAGCTTSANNGTFTVTAIGSNYFEVTNASGVAQASAAGYAGNTHCDGIQIQTGVSNVLINHNAIYAPTTVTGVTSAIFVSPDIGPAGPGPVTIMNNYLSGGPYNLIIVDGGNGLYHTSGLSVISNTFAKNGLYGATRITEPSPYWSAYYGNVYTDKTPVSPGVLTALQQTSINGYLSPAFNASFTPNWRDGRTTNVGTLTAAITINAPASNPGYTSTIPSGTQLTLLLTQDATGGRAITWNAIFLRSGNLASGSAATSGQRASISFTYDGTNWVETAVSPWH